MKSTRLTKQLEFSILNKAMAWKFGRLEAEHKVDEHRLAEEVYVDIFPPELQQLLTKIPAWMLNEAECIRLPGAVREIIDPKCAMKLGHRSGTVRLEYAPGKAKRVPYTGEYDQALPEPAVHSLKTATLKRLTAYMLEQAALEVRRSAFRRGLTELFAQINTTAKLVELMPQAEEWLKTTHKCSDMPQADIVAGILSV